LLTSDKKHIIIEVKMYKDGALIDSYGSKKLRADHLRQILAYLDSYENQVEKNEESQRLKKTATGILLYANDQEGNYAIKDDKCEKNIFKQNILKYKYKQHPLFVKTINLYEDWEQIKENLLQVVNSDNG